ncbi:thiamine pyrophosphate-dependent dehydrogenase E1 component subunit alpha, partial [uncultured Agrococcus sp.]|uniref:thiamine pyrophosphate-dependent dehydrogenase E1 component subunit alpha n=1 Tax=uncultured Agrococcus sp. TaxID=382258 RepID=UPI0025F7AD97
MATQITDNPELAESTLETLWRIRRFEEAVEDLYGRGMMHGTMHLSIGQEAVPAGATLALRQDDAITSTHRGHGHAIAKGADLTRMMAELLAKESGYARGRGGSMHIADTKTGNLGANGIVAGGVPIATGAALSAQMRGTDQVALCYHGDGAMGEGAWHEGVVLAVMWQLPVVYLCENNLYGMSMSSKQAFRLEQLSDRAKGYGMPGVDVDGNDVQAVYDAVDEAVSRARAGGGPSFIVANTYRWRGHSKSDKNLYRTR